MSFQLKAAVGVVLVVPLSTFAITYPLALMTPGHIPPGLNIPYLSNTINNPPESCIGAFGLYIACLGALVLMNFKFVLIRDRLFPLLHGASSAAAPLLEQPDFGPTGPDAVVDSSNFDAPFYNRLNVAAVIIGFISVLGLAGVASFQVRNAHAVHMTSALTFFLGSLAYESMIVHLDRRMRAHSELFPTSHTSHLPSLPSSRLTCARITFCIFTGMTCLPMVASMILHDLFKDVESIENKSMSLFFWNGAALLETLLVVSFFMFYSSFFMEYKEARIGLKIVHRSVPTRRERIMQK